MVGIYKITSPSGKIYIGQSVNIKSRHRDYLKLGYCKLQRRLNFSFVKYGVLNHIFETIELCNLEDLNERERYWQDFYDACNKHKGLNCRLTGTKDKSGVMSKETKQRVSDTFKLRGTVKGGNNPMFGKKHSEESRNKMSKFHSGKKLSKVQIEDIKMRFKGSLNPRAKIVLNTETGIYYDYAKDAADSINMIHGTFHAKLNGRLKNSTSFIYV